jgi:hypothetical protein
MSTIRWLELCFVLSISEPTSDCSSSGLGSSRVVSFTLLGSQRCPPNRSLSARRAVTSFPQHGWWKPIAPNCRSATHFELLLPIQRNCTKTAAHCGPRALRPHATWLLSLGFTVRSVLARPWPFGESSRSAYHLNSIVVALSYDRSSLPDLRFYLYYLVFS